MLRMAIPYCTLFGDSITQYSVSIEHGGWANKLADYYSAKLDVVNRGFSGYNTRMAKCLLNKVFPLEAAERPLFATVFFGANDAAYPPNPQHVPLDEYTNNLRDIIAHMKKVTNNVILISPPAFYHEGWRKWCEDTKKPIESTYRSDDLAGTYTKAAIAVAAELGASFIDLHSEMHRVKPHDWQVYLHDGLHLSKEGNELLFNLLKKLIEKQLSSIQPLKLPLYGGMAPLWSEVNMNNPSESIKP